MAGKEKKVDIARGLEANANVANLDHIYSSYTIDNMTSINGMMRTISNDIYKDNAINKISRYNGQILRVDKRKASDINANNSFNLQFVKELKSDTIIVTYKVRIPALDGMLPIPSLKSGNDKNNKIIDMYQDYTPDDPLSEFNVGDYVEVEFDNNKTFSDGRIVSSYKAQYQSTVADPGDSSKASTDTQNSSNNPDAINATENSLASYKPNETPVYLLGREEGANKANVRSKIPKNINYVIADIPSTANSFPGTYAGKDRKLLIVRIPKECVIDGENHFLTPRARDQLAKMNQDYNKWANENNITPKNLSVNESIRSFQDQINIFNARYDPPYETLVAKYGNKVGLKKYAKRKEGKSDAATPGFSDNQQLFQVDDR